MTTRQEVIDYHRSNPKATAREIAEALACGSAYVRKAARLAGLVLPGSIRTPVQRIVTDAERAEIIRQRSAGVQGVVIAAQMKVTPACICKVWRRHQREMEAEREEKAKRPAYRPQAPLMGIGKVSRKIVSRTSQCSVGHGKNYGYAMVSLPRVSLIDGPEAA